MIVNCLKLLFVFLITIACSNIEFVYKTDENLINPLYNNTSFAITGSKIPYINRYMSSFFGDEKDGEYRLFLDINESKTKSAVEKNQTISSLRYDLNFSYQIISLKKNCVSYEKSIVSYFTSTPKSSGFNFGSDKSVNKQYELVIKSNIENFISFLGNVDISACIDES